MKKIWLIGLMMVWSLHSFAQSKFLKDRDDLKQLLKERIDKFSSYTESLDKRSGFFGNKTKKDISHSNEVLIEIVKTDNKIISLLNRVVDFKNYEKINMNYDLQHSDDRMENLLHATDTLSSQVTLLKATNKTLGIKVQKLQWIIALLTIALIVIVVLYRRKAV
jgi:hypothetical protein